MEKFGTGGESPRWCKRRHNMEENMDKNKEIEVQIHLDDAERQPCEIWTRL